MKRFLLPVIFVLLIGFANVSGETTRLTKVYSFINGENGYAVLNNKDESLIVTYFNNIQESNGVFWYKEGKKTIITSCAENGSVSPDGKYYFYTKNKELYIFRDNKSLVCKIVLMEEPESLVWAYNSEQLYVCVCKNSNNDIYCISVQNGTIKNIMSSKFYHPITVRDPNKLFLLEDIEPNAPASNAKIVQYDLKTKKVVFVKIPYIKDLYIYQYFTVSPDGRVVIFNSNGKIYIVDIVNKKVIESFELPGNFKITETPDVSDYSWKSDGSYVIFAYYSGKPEYGIYKYTLPKY
jgi:WD40 repeat protein